MRFLNGALEDDVLPMNSMSGYEFNPSLCLNCFYNPYEYNLPKHVRWYFAKYLISKSPEKIITTFIFGLRF